MNRRDRTRTGARSGGRAGARTRGRTGALVAVTALLALVSTACSDEDRDKVGGAVSEATAAVASAASAAEEKMKQVKDGVNATGDVKAGAIAADGDRTTAEITATNPKDKAADYTVLVNFRDDGGKLLDTVVLNIDGVEPGASKKGTARSNRSISGAAEAQIGQALRR